MSKEFEESVKQDFILIMGALADQRDALQKMKASNEVMTTSMASLQSKLLGHDERLDKIEQRLDALEQSSA